MGFILSGENALRIIKLAKKHQRTPVEQLELMLTTFETMDIHRLIYLPRPPGGQQIPIIEVYGPVIQRGARQ